MSVAEESQVGDARSLNLIGAGAASIQGTTYLRWKGALDRILAALLLIPGLPAMGLLVIIIRLTSRGPGIYSQKRVGKRGNTYTMYKLRSMRVDAETDTGAVWTKERDPRITWFGGFLRKSHLDELPQLFNVIKGEMSLIGPRPERPEFVCVLAECIPEYAQRLAVLPGITGLAQINLPPDTDLDSVRRKLILDLQYIRTARISLDIRLLMCTALRAVGIHGDLSARLLWVYRTVSSGDGAAGERSGDATPWRIARQAAGEDSCDEDSCDKEQGAALEQSRLFGGTTTVIDDSHQKNGKPHKWKQETRR